MSIPDSAPAPGEKSARAPLSAPPGLSCRLCPAPGCGRPLTERQGACSNRCRAALSRLRREAAQLARDARLRELLAAAVKLLEKGWEQSSSSAGGAFYGQ